MSRWLALIAIVSLAPACGPHNRNFAAGLFAIAATADAISQTIQEQHRAEREARREAELEAHAAALADYEISLAAQPAVYVPHGFFCAQSTSDDAISLCTRDPDACVQARDAATIGVPDLAACAPVERAWCFAGHCYASPASCDRSRSPDAVGSCAAVE